MKDKVISEKPVKATMELKGIVKEYKNEFLIVLDIPKNANLKIMN